jgi:hypothetical protein
MVPTDHRACRNDCFSQCDFSVRALGNLKLDCTTGLGGVDWCLLKDTVVGVEVD